MESVYHSGELRVQERAGVRANAERIARSIRPAIPVAAQEFLRSQSMAIVGSVDAVGRVWASLLRGDPGFLQALDDRTLWIRSRPAPGDPLADNLTVNEEAGLIAIEFATRRRMRVNGRAEVAADGAVYIHVRQVYSNCPKYIRPREVSKRPGRSGLAPRVVRRSSLTHEQRQWIREADTFFVASHHPAGGTDASHRGGRPGFVRVPDADRLIWPDYPGNTMFQTLGNIAARPQSGLLFIDFERDRTLQLTGRARIIWDEERAGDFDGAERLLEFGVAEAIEISESPKT